MGNSLKMMLSLLLVFCAAKSFAFNCSVSTTPVNFINYDVFSPSPGYSTGIVLITCNAPAQNPLTVNISINSGGSGTFNPRQMRAATGSDRLNYYLFTDASRTVIWGDGTSGTSTVTNLVTKNVPWNATIFGMLPPRQNLSAGNYRDTLLVTVNW